MDDGPPWSGERGSDDDEHWTISKNWLLKLGVIVVGGRRIIRRHRGRTSGVGLVCRGGAGGA
jgi:hypothetical protein